MNNYFEMLEAVASIATNLHTYFQLLITLAVIYMVAIYNVGTRLRTLQVALLNLVYLLVYCLSWLGYFTARQTFTRAWLETEAFAKREEITFEHIVPVPDYFSVDFSNVIALLYGAAILIISLAFSWTIRHGGKQIAAPHSLQNNGSD